MSDDSKAPISFSGPTSNPIVGDATYGYRPALTQPLVRNDSEQNTFLLKALARELNADLVGVCANDDKLLRPNGEVAKRGGAQRFGWVVVIGVNMDREGFRTSPSDRIHEATREGYARMKVMASALADGLAARGWESFAAGNGEAWSVALAYRAGLGQLGRNGMLLASGVDGATGSCLRLCKVFTSLPLIPDQPAARICADVCRECTQCAQSCPAGAIEDGDSPAGKYWQIDGEKCRAKWSELETRCAACITHCPLTWGATGESARGSILSAR